jgi:hypothetical protein
MISLCDVATLRPLDMRAVNETSCWMEFGVKAVGVG